LPHTLRTSSRSDLPALGGTGGCFASMKEVPISGPPGRGTGSDEPWSPQRRAGRNSADRCQA
jgi:hypothetical protein